MRVGLAGFGNMGGHHALLLGKHAADIKLVAIADADESRRAKAEKEFPDVNIWNSGQEMLENEALDVLFVCSPTYLHAELSIMGLEKGCHVFCEKPMALNADECDAMIKAAEKSGKYLLIGQVLRFWPEYVFLKEAIEDKRYGKLMTLSMTRVGGVSRGWQDWFLDEKRGGMQIFDRHIHDSDAVLWLLGKPESVRSYGFSKDASTEGGIVHNFTNYNYGPDLLVNAEGSADMPAGFPFTVIYRATFENACLEYHGRNTPGLTLFKDGETSNPLDVEDEEIKSNLNISSAGPYFNEQVYFFNCIKNSQSPENATGAQAKESIKLVRAEIESVRSNKTVFLK